MTHDIRRWLNAMQTLTEAAAKGRFPVRQLDEVFHVGSMRSGAKSSMSFEGAGLSVSLHPTIWRRIGKGWVDGKLWRLTRAGGRFLDHAAMSESMHAAILRWGADNGYVTLYKRGGATEVYATDTLRKRTGMLIAPGIAETLVLTLYVEDETDLDGIWWDDPINARVAGSAPRGVILAARLPRWAVEQISDDAAPDKDAFKRKRRARLAEGAAAPLDIDKNPLIDMDDRPIATNRNGTVTLYHRTSQAAAKQINRTGRFVSRESTQEVFFSNIPNGQAASFGDYVVEVKVHPSRTRLTDALHGEMYLAVPTRYLSSRNVVGIYAAPVQTLDEGAEPIPDCAGPCLYHATFARYVPAIMQHGLGARTKRKNFNVSRQGRVYLTNHPDVAQNYAEEAASQRGDDDEIVVLLIDQRQLNPALLHTDENDTGVMLDIYADDGPSLWDDEEYDNRYISYEYHGVIPPSALSIMP